MANRRSVLIGLGGLVAGGGALLGTGAFTSVSAERTVNVATSGDASAFLSLQAADRTDDTDDSPSNIGDEDQVNQNEYVQQTDGTIVINLDGGDDEDADDAGTGLNQRAKTTFENLVTVTNNGTQNVNSLTLSMAVTNLDTGNINDSQYQNGSVSSLTAGEVESTFGFTVSDTDENSGTPSNGTDILGSTGISDGTLAPGESFTFGMVINLLNELYELPGGTTEYTLEITAETTQS
ncbi:hypothetical protein [Halorubrum laminariae]|uniref:DUF1102 domain-containing protein n=1 Tax=Halorubrum laminariae TaxID=1433523 RepID=A0ABD6C4D1_9EURY|nr:hypothetical protein [Halorubrum laminariae]